MAVLDPQLDLNCPGKITDSEEEGGGAGPSS